MRDTVSFFINGRPQTVGGAQIFSTLSQYLRYDVGATGTKIVCEEGDCGACTVLIGRARGDAFDYQPVNSCIQSLFQLDGTSVVTVEGLGTSSNMNAVQQAMVTCHGAQCGYCTPGFIVAMTAMFETCNRVDEQKVRDGLTGNLCRCTGYEPIIKAALEVDGATMPKTNERYPAKPMLDARPSGGIRIEADGRVFSAPETIEEAAAFKRDHPGCTIVQGGTDVGVWINKRHFTAPAILSLANLRGLEEIREHAGELEVGARVTLAAFEEAVRERIPELHRILTIFGSPQIRNAGTLAGNIANGSPIGDTIPYLFISDARLELTGANGTREVPVASFYRGYKTFDLKPDELITRVFVPMIDSNRTLRLYKVSRRKDLDISAFTAAILIDIRDGVISAARVVYGGVGPVVLRLPRTEEALTGKAPTLATFEAAGVIARGEISPISDVRGSRDYRLQLAENILQKFWFDAFAAAPASSVTPRPAAPSPTA